MGYAFKKGRNYYLKEGKARVLHPLVLVVRRRRKGKARATPRERLSFRRGKESHRPDTPHLRRASRIKGSTAEVKNGMSGASGKLGESSGMRGSEVQNRAMFRTCCKAFAHDRRPRSRGGRGCRANMPSERGRRTRRLIVGQQASRKAGAAEHERDHLGEQEGANAQRKPAYKKPNYWGGRGLCRLFLSFITSPG